MSGKTNREMAQVEDITVRAIESRRREAMLKLGARSVAELTTMINRMDRKGSRDWRKPLK